MSLIERNIEIAVADPSTGAPNAWPTAVADTTGERRPPRIRKGLVLALACAAQAMVGLDIAIVNVALPSIQRDLGVGQSMLQWVVVAYSLLLGGFLLLGGRMADQLGRRRILVVGLAVFTAASFLAGAAQDGGPLIAARAVQGFGAALIAPAALSLLAVTFAEGRERHRAIGLFGAVGGVAGSVGVVAGGLLAGGPGWRWSFLINVPVGVVLIMVAVVFLARDRAGDRTTRLDIAGATTITGGLLLFVYALHHGANHGWISGSTLALFTAAVVLLAAFVRIEARTAAPLVPASTLKNRTLVVANLTAFFASCAFLSFIFIGSLLMQQALGYSPTKTGLAWLATTVTCFAAAMASARPAARVGVRWLLISGISLFAIGTLWLARVPADASYLVDVLPAFLLAGIGGGLFSPALQIGALSGVSRSDSGLASGLVETMREIGGAAGVAAVSTVLLAGSGLDGFHAGFTLIGVLAILGVVTAAFGFARGAREPGSRRPTYERRS
jgi:EmrB/QacA subfamily drug resistance transporter